MPPSSRARRGIRALVATSGLALVASSATLIGSAAHAADPVDIQIIGTNDFHGRLLPDRDIPGAAKYAGAVDQLRAENPNTIFAVAGDLIGATTFESFIDQDKPTIDIFNAMDLDVSAVGNHELDQGYDDLVNRVMAPYDATSNPKGGAQWQYIAANIDEPGDADEIAPSWTKDVGGVTVGFVGAITEHLPELVSPGGIAGLTVTDIVDATNEEAAELRADGADLVVMLVHEGAPSTDCATMDDDPTSDFGSIISGVSGDVDAIISGHTHLNYSCSFPVADWISDPDHVVKDRPVVSAGQYGAYLNKLDFTVEPDTGALLAVTNANLNLNTGTYPNDPEVQQIVDAAKANADVQGAKPLGDIAGPFKRAARPKADNSGSEENRGGESTLGNLVAEAQRWATESATTGSAQIAFMNPGGLRADMVGNGPTYPTTLTYKQAATVQPFANTLVNMDLTGAQIETVLEQQWQPAGSSRPFLRLGTSKGFTYTYDPAAKTITGMWLDGTPIEAGQTYSVTVNSFLATGGDNFTELANGTNKKDTGKTDLQAMVDYMAEFADDAPLPVDNAQHAVGVTWPAGAPASYGAGDTLAFDLSSLAMTGAGDVQDAEVTVSLGQHELGTFPVDNTVTPGATDDEAGRASVSLTLPAGLPGGDRVLRVTGDQTGTVVRVPVTLEKAASTTSATATPKKVVVDKTRPTVRVTVRAAGEPATGKVELRTGGKTWTVRLSDGRATAKLPAFGRPGTRTVRVLYLGNASTEASRTTVTIEVVTK
ncbi:bifunctional metallophosphatase/5'-nucleotidase [Nocardioides sp.]|uniref:bifunctional metallophosphatase/5'-nucleotidase n=1 Tax=Nocardioides sp. TaxID=35761 RepID=UPI003784A97E